MSHRRSGWLLRGGLALVTFAPAPFVIGTDDDQHDLRATISRSLHPSARTFVRCVYESAFTAQLARRPALAEHIASWTGGPR